MSLSSSNFPLRAQRLFAYYSNKKELNFFLLAYCQVSLCLHIIKKSIRSQGEVNDSSSMFQKHFHTLTLPSALFSSYLLILTTSLGEFFIVNGAALENSRLSGIVKGSWVLYGESQGESPQPPILQTLHFSPHWSYFVILEPGHGRLAGVTFTVYKTTQ